jgi:hypothetical protein
MQKRKNLNGIAIFVGRASRAIRSYQPALD